MKKTEQKDAEARRPKKAKAKKERKERKSPFRAIFRALCKPSTRPDITSYKWARREFSILSILLLWTVWVGRVLSLFQHVKQIYRVLGKKFKFGYTENASGRPDVPPWLGEIYYIAWTLLFLSVHFLAFDNLFLRILAVYYLFESTVWILYYTIFRRFFELGYTIYHRLEYITMIVLILPTQALCFSHLYGKSFHAMLTALLGSSDESTPLLLTVLGYVFAAIVISMIISTFPTENIKKIGRKAKTFVIGCGDVVTKRLLPAILNSSFAVSTEFFDLEECEEKKDFCSYLPDSDAICERVDGQLDKNSVIWIETPPCAHCTYVEHFLKSKAKLIVVEKPIAAEREELERICALAQDKKNRSRLFFLSYYILEKALPLSYLHALSEENAPRASAYEKYLNVQDGALLRCHKTLLGELVSASVTISEGEDERTWVKDKTQGGQLLETFLHNVLIASLFCGPVSKWSELSFTDADPRKKEQRIHLTAKSGEARICLTLVKGGEEKHRTASFVFRHGTILADFDRQTAEVTFDLLQEHRNISVKHEFRRRYGILVDLVKETVSELCRAEDVDGLDGQRDVIRLLLELQGQAN